MTNGQFNTRLPVITHDQISQIADETGLTKTQVVILAIDRFWLALHPDEVKPEDIERIIDQFPD